MANIVSTEVPPPDPRRIRITRGGRTLFRVGAIACTLALPVSHHLVAKAFQAPPPLAIDRLDPYKAHVAVSVVDDAGIPRPPDLRFYSTRNLSGAPAMRIEGRGVIIDDALVCRWPDTAFDFPATRQLPDLVSAADATQPCPADVPIRPSPEAPFGVYLVVAQLNGTTLQVAYRGATYYISLRAFRGFQGELDGTAPIVRWPAASPPLIGGVDIPAAFSANPTGRRFAVPVRAAAALDSPVAATLSTLRVFENFSLGGGAHVAAVYARIGRWSLLRLIDGRALWLAPQDAGKFVSLERMVSGGNASLTSAWDRTFARTPGDGERVPAPPDPRRAFVGYLEPRAPVFAAVPIFATPDRTQPPVAQFDNDNNWWTLTRVSQSVRGGGPLVFSRRPGWLEVALDRVNPSYRGEGATRAWLEDDPGQWTLRLVDAIEGERLLTDVWGPEALPAVEVLGTRRIGQTLWLHLRLFVGEACESGLIFERQVLAQGWVPAHNHLGRPTVWYETYCD